MNHGRSNVPIRFCPDCGEEINNTRKERCDEVKHASRRKSRNIFCFDCGKKIREV